ncbi:MAG: hypothetical protein J5855_10250 [Mailhella sp.]|nr:hypothetical protein [Mailhella sp.]
MKAGVRRLSAFNLHCHAGLVFSYLAFPLSHGQADSRMNDRRSGHAAFKFDLAEHVQKIIPDQHHFVSFFIQ